MRCFVTDPCGFRAQSVQQTDDFENDGIGGEDWYNVVSAHAVASLKELYEVVHQHQIHIDATINKFVNIQT